MDDTNDSCSKISKKPLLAIVLENLLHVVIVVFLVVMMFYGAEHERINSFALTIVWLFGMLIRYRIIKYVWYERAIWFGFFLIAFVFPLMTFVTVGYYAGQYFGWW